MVSETGRAAKGAIPGLGLQAGARTSVPAALEDAVAAIEHVLATLSTDKPQPSIPQPSAAEPRAVSYVLNPDTPLTIFRPRLQGCRPVAPVSGSRVGPAAEALGNRLTVDPRTLTPLVLVRIQVPQPSKIKDLSVSVCYDAQAQVVEGNAMRLLAMLLLAFALAGCQSTTNSNEKPKECDRRAVESGLCVPGEYENE